MVKGSIVLVAAVAFVALCSLRKSPAFVPPAGRPVQVPLATIGGLASLCAVMPAARAADVEVLDAVDEAAKRLADACYPIFEDYDWVRAPSVTKWITTSFQYGQPPLRLAEFSDKLLELGMAMDQDLVRKAVQAHEKAVSHGVRTAKLLAPLSDVEATFITIARMLKSAPAASILAIHDSALELGVDTFKIDSFSGGLNQAEVDRAYALFLELGSLVKDR